MRKTFILMLYGTALFWILREYYKNPSNTGMPTPKTLSAPTYLYAILSLASDFTGGFTVPLAAGLTVGLIWQVQAKNSTATALQKAAAVATNKPPPGPVGPVGETTAPTPAQTRTAAQSAFNQR